MTTEVTTDQRIQHAYARFISNSEFPASLAMRVAYIAGWRAGGADVLRGTARLADLVPTLRELIRWLETDDDELPR